MAPSGSVLRSVRELLIRVGPRGLTIDDLGAHDLAALGWSGTPLHIETMSAALERVPTGEVEYLVARAPTGEPIAKGGIDHADQHGPGKLRQLATHEELRRLGVGTRLIEVVEERIRDERTSSGVARRGARQPARPTALRAPGLHRVR